MCQKWFAEFRPGSFCWVMLHGHVCLEPWWGINDDYYKKTDLSQKRGIMALNSKESKEFCWEVSVCE